MSVRKRDVLHVGPSSGQYVTRYISNNAYKSTTYHNPESPKDRAGNRRIEMISENQRYKKPKFGQQIHYTNNVHHTVNNILWFPWSGIRYYGSTYYNDFSGGMFLDRSPYREYATNLNYDPKPPASFNARAFQAMYPDLETSLSLSNFIVELRDMKRLYRFFKEWKGKQKAIKRLAKRYKYAVQLRKLGKDSPKIRAALKQKVPSRLNTATQFAAEAHLSYKFGIRPFIGDVIKLIESLTDYQRRIDDFLMRRDRVQKRHYSEQEPWSRTDSSWYKWQGSNTCSWRYRTAMATKDTATMTYEYTCPDLDTFALKLKAIRDMIGLRFTPSVIWESIPFSFVVDWFFRVQDFLEANEDPLIKAVVTVHDYSISRKLTYQCERQWKYWSSPGGNSWGYHTDANHYGTSYIRQRVLPDAESTFIDRGQYGLNQLALSISLLRVNFR